MAKVYSQDLRERLIGAVERGQSASAAGRVFGVSRSIAVKWAQHWRRLVRAASGLPEFPHGPHYRERISQ